LTWLGWLPGEAIIFELLEDQSVCFRKPKSDEFMVKGARLVRLDNSLPGERSKPEDETSVLLTAAQVSQRSKR
jgi:hypothetical protein